MTYYRQLEYGILTDGILLLTKLPNGSNITNERLDGVGMTSKFQYKERKALIVEGDLL